MLLIAISVTIFEHYVCFRQLLAYLMVPIMQKEIDTFVHVVWNTHRIRAQKNTLLPDGVPNHIYSLEECGTDSIFIYGGLLLILVVDEKRSQQKICFGRGDIWCL